MLLVNEAKNANHWLGVKLTGTKSNRSAIGARVVLHGSKRNWVDEVRSGSSYNSSSDLRLHFGLGSDAKPVSVKVRWPNGEKELFPVEGIDRMIEVTEGSGKALP
jgi:hypothetical protein